MPCTNQPPSDKLLLEAVELRAGGYKWEIVAEKLKRALGTVKKWPLRYPDRWQVAMERAERRLAVDSEAESVVVLRNMLRDDDAKMRWHAAKTLVGLRLELGKLAIRATGRVKQEEPVDKTIQLFQVLDKFSDDEINSLTGRPGGYSRESVPFPQIAT